MKSSHRKHQGTCQDMEQSPNSTINRLPDEALLEVFDSYRQSINIDQYDSQWRKKYAWFNLALVCRRWRTVMFASSSRLDLNIVVGPEKPGHIKTILSGHLPILIDYLCPRELPAPYENEKSKHLTPSALWRMRAALRHRDRVREISFGGCDAISIGKFISATNYHFPALESLDIRFPRQLPEPEIPSTFLRGPDQSDLRLRRLRLSDVSVASVSGLLLSTTALTDLTLSVTSAMASQGSFLLDCLQGMEYLRSLNLTTPRHEDSQSQRSVLSAPKDIVPLLKLTHFHYSGHSTFLNSLLSRLSAPSLQDARFVFRINSPLLYLSRFIDHVREEFRSVSVTFDMYHFHLLSSTHSGKIEHFKPSFMFNVNNSSYSINSMNSMPSTKLAMVKELALNFDFPSSGLTNWDGVLLLREFLRQFRNVRVLRVNPFLPEIGLYLQQDDEEPILPVLEEVELSILRLTRYSDEEYQRRVAEALAIFKSCERAGRPVKVYHCERT